MDQCILNQRLDNQLRTGTIHDSRIRLYTEPYIRLFILLDRNIALHMLQFI